jgi:hypothetical protein
VIDDNFMKSCRISLAPAALLALTSALGGCKDVDDFTTHEGEHYCGAVVAGPFVRDGFGPAVKLRLSFDAAAIAQGPGTISTDDGLFVDARLLPIPQVFHDPLSTLQFGEGQKRSLLYALAPSGPAGGAPLSVILSLMENGQIEVRLFRAGDPKTNEPAQAASYFGVFPLARQKGDCF